MKAVIKSYLNFFLLIFAIIITGLLAIEKVDREFICKNYPLILSTLFYSFGTLGFLVNVTTWGGESIPEKTSKRILVICYCVGTFFTIYGIK
jgi:hypothetical protein